MGAAWCGADAAEMPTRADAAIVFAPAGAVVPPALAALDAGGTVALAGIHMTPIPSLDPKYGVIDWTGDDRELHVISGRAEERQSRVFRLDPKTGKMEFWKEFGGNMAGLQSVGAPIFAQNADAYAYVYTQILSEGYVVTNLQ